jgi:uncharacterized protein (TIGR00645 family)
MDTHVHTPAPEAKRPRPRGVLIVEAIVFNVKWVLPVFYFGLVVVLALYGVLFLKEIWHLVLTANRMSTEELRIVALDMGDIVMVANLIKMIIAGSYNSFITKDHGRPGENISSGMLKVKISTSVIVVATIGLLPEFVSFKPEHLEALVGKLAMYAMFLWAARVLADIEFLHIRGEVLESKNEKHEKH